MESILDQQLQTLYIWLPSYIARKVFACKCEQGEREVKIGTVYMLSCMSQYLIVQDVLSAKKKTTTPPAPKKKRPKYMYYREKLLFNGGLGLRKGL